MASASLEELEQRLSRLEAIQGIERLKYRYLRACDRKDPEAIRECFVRDGAQLDYGPLGKLDGRDALVDVFTRLALRRDGGTWLYHDMHHGHHPDIDVLDDGTATGRWTLSFLRVNLDAGAVEQASIEYDDCYVVEGDSWKIRSSRVTPLTSFSLPLPEATRVAAGAASPEAPGPP